MTESSSSPPSAPSSVGAANLQSLIGKAVAARQAGRLSEAASLFAQAAEQDPGNSGLLLFYGETLYRLGRLFSAHDTVVAAMRAAPENPDAEFLLGRILIGLGRPADAVPAFERSVLQRPAAALTWRFMAVALHALGRAADSEAAFAEADEVQKESAEGYNQIGIDLLGQRRPVEAEAAFRRAAALNPALAPAHQNLGASLAAQERLRDAIAAERRAVALAPRSAAAWNNLAVFEGARGAFIEAREAVTQALKIEPTHVDALNTLAQIRLEEGDAHAAIDLVERARARQPAHRAVGSSLLLYRNYVAVGQPAALRDEAKAVVAGLRPEGPSFVFQDRDRDTVRRLRVGYVSGDFRRHSCANFIAPLFAAHDPQAIEIFAYSENPTDDEITTALRAHTRYWRPIVALGDGAAAELIHRDRIDILVDLSGHMAGNRLPVFALKPAPIQLTWLGYPSTTGLSTIDYRITDSRVDPPGKTDSFYTERLWRLPECFLAYKPISAAPVIDRDTSSTAAVFGSFNHLPKVTPDVVAAWARIMREVAGSRLVMKAKRLGEADVRNRYLKLFADQGVDGDRLELIGWQQSPADHMALYRRIDIALDPFPYNGTTTTCESLWMDVPVLTLAGDTPAGRVGASLLGAMGLDTLVATSEQDYVERAVALARDNAGLAEIRNGLRERLQASPLGDAPGFARRLEAAYRGMWERWCTTGTA